VTADSDAEPTEETPPPQTPPATAASVSEPFRELIENGLARDRNAMSIWQEMVDRHSFTGAYESVKRFVRKLRGPTSPEALAVITTEPGQEAQVDYGTGPTIRDPATGKYRRSRLFVLTRHSAIAANAFAFSPFNPARASGPNCMSVHSANSVAP